MSDEEENLYHDPDGWLTDEDITANLREPMEATTEEGDEENPLPQPGDEHANFHRQVSGYRWDL